MELSEVRQGFANGVVIHQRKHPKEHQFKYNMCWCLFDLDNLDDWAKMSKLWRFNRWSIFSLLDEDYVTKERQPIKEKISTLLEHESGLSFTGKVYLFTHPRFLGYGFNSVNFYFCYQDNALVYIVSEINNTPWGEKYLYFHDCLKAKTAQGCYKFNFDKQFHISPFLSMDMKYQWEFDVNPEGLKVKMNVHKDNVNVMNVYLHTKITPVMENNINRFALRSPFQPWKMALGIYWQAFKLWVKKVPFHSHPERD